MLLKILHVCDVLEGTPYTPLTTYNSHSLWQYTTGSWTCREILLRKITKPAIFLRSQLPPPEDETF